MDQDDCRAFLHLAETLHFGRTAQALHMSTSALTRLVQRLEEEVGHPLFIRDRRSVLLSEAGHRLRGFAQAQLDGWNALRRELAADWESPAGDLHIACTVTACYTLLPRLLAECRRRHPRVALKLNTQDAARSLLQLEAGEVDLAVVPSDGASSPPLHRLALADTALVFIAPAADDALGPAECELDWSSVPIVAPEQGLDRQRLDHWLRERRLAPPIAAEVRGNEAILAMVSMGAGVALVPELVLEASPLRSRVRRLAEPPPPGYTVSLCATERSLGRRVVEVFWAIAGETTHDGGSTDAG